MISRPQDLPPVYTLTIAQAGLEMTVCRHADPVAGRTEFPMHGTDETDIFPEARNLVVNGWAIALSLLYRL